MCASLLFIIHVVHHFVRRRRGDEEEEGTAWREMAEGERHTVTSPWPSLDQSLSETDVNAPLAAG